MADDPNVRGCLGLRAGTTLPAITVGTVIRNRDSEARAMEDHQTIRREFGLLEEAHGTLSKSLQEFAVGVHELPVHSEHDKNAAAHTAT